jgi:hypothetical protein
MKPPFGHHAVVLLFSLDAAPIFLRDSFEGTGNCVVGFISVVARVTIAGYYNSISRLSSRGTSLDPHGFL